MFFKIGITRGLSDRFRPTRKNRQYQYDDPSAVVASPMLTTILLVFLSTFLRMRTLHSISTLRSESVLISLFLATTIRCKDILIWVISHFWWYLAVSYNHCACAEITISQLPGKSDTTVGFSVCDFLYKIGIAYFVQWRMVAAVLSLDRQTISHIWFIPVCLT